MRPAPDLVFSLQAVLALPDGVTDCQGAWVKGNRDASGHGQVLCGYLPGDISRPALAASDERTVIVVLAPDAARALARKLERAAEEAEEQ
jgi:hypothetical protein